MAEYAKFDDAWLAEFRSISGVTDQAASAALRDDLIEVGKNYRRIIENTPCDLPGAPYNKSLTQRGDWLQTNVLNPVERLLGALAESQRPMFSTWPYEKAFAGLFDHSALQVELEKLKTDATDLLKMLRGEQGADAGTSQELRFYIFNEIINAIKRHLPDFVPKQGVYHANMRQFVGRYPDAIRHIYKEITGLDEQLVRLIRMMVKDPEWSLNI